MSTTPRARALADSIYRPVWLEDDGRPEPLPPLRGDVSCQLLIVGGGYTGLWAALQAKEREPDIDVVLVERTFVGDGASGRNGGFFLPILTHNEGNPDYHFGGEMQRLNELGLENARDMIATLERHGIDAHYENVGLTTVASDEGSAARLRAEYEAEKAAGADVEWFDGDAMRGEVYSPTYRAGLLRREEVGGVLHPARLCWGLREAALSLGVRIYEGTAVTGMEPSGAGMRTTCEQGVIRSDKVLLATNAFPGVVPQIRRQVIPLWDYQIATEPLNGEQLDAIRWGKTRHALFSAANMFHYYRLTKDNRITWGGGGSIAYYYGARTDDGVADDRSRFEDLARDFLQTFPQLEGIRFTHRWSGFVGASVRTCVVFGTAHEGRVAWSIGYTGRGVGASRFGARVALELLGYRPSDILDLKFIRAKVANWPPDPIRWLGVNLTRRALVQADANGGRRGLWLKLLDHFNLGTFG